MKLDVVYIKVRTTKNLIKQKKYFYLVILFLNNLSAFHFKNILKKNEIYNVYRLASDIFSKRYLTSLNNNQIKSNGLDKDTSMHNCIC